MVVKFSVTASFLYTEKLTANKYSFENFYSVSYLLDIFLIQYNEGKDI